MLAGMIRSAPEAILAWEHGQVLGRPKCRSPAPAVRDFSVNGLAFALDDDRPALWASSNSARLQTSSPRRPAPSSRRRPPASRPSCPWTCRPANGPGTADRGCDRPDRIVQAERSVAFAPAVPRPRDASTTNVGTTSRFKRAASARPLCPPPTIRQYGCRDMPSSAFSSFRLQASSAGPSRRRASCRRYVSARASPRVPSIRAT